MMSTILAKICYNKRQEFLALIDRKFSASADMLTKEIESFQAKSLIGINCHGKRLPKPRKDRWHF